MGFCKHCHYWEPGALERAGEPMGVCHNVNVAGKIIQDRETSITEDTTTYTPQYFGCIFYRKGAEHLINFNKLTEKQ